MKIGLKKKIINGRIANELYLKRLIVGGFDGVYEFSKNFKVDAFKVFSKWDFEDSCIAALRKKTFYNDH